jgi:hypothetical protein
MSGPGVFHENDKGPNGSSEIFLMEIYGSGESDLMLTWGSGDPGYVFEILLIIPFVPIGILSSSLFLL